MALEMPNPFRREEKAAPPPPVSTREWSRLYVMGFVLFLVVACMIYMKKMSDTLGKSKERPGPGQVDYKVRDTSGGEVRPPGKPDGAAEEKKVVQVPPPPSEEAVNFRELAAPFRDGEEKIVKETPEFLALVSVFLKSVTRAGIARKVTPGLTADRAFLEPAKHRGDVLRVFGRLIQIYTERVEVTTTDNVEFVYLGVMQEYMTNRTVCFYLPEKPLDPATEKPIEFHSYRKRGEEFFTDWVEVEGVFLRQYVYPSQLEDERGQTVYARAAALFAKNLRLARKPEIADPRGSFVFIIGGLAVVIAAIVIVAGVMSRKYSSGSMRVKVFQMKHQKEIAARAAAAPVSPPAGPPPAPEPKPPAAEGSPPPTPPQAG